MTNPIILLICGDRNWTDMASIGRAIDNYTGSIKLVIHGGCRGADRLAGEAAKNRRIPVKVYYANWNQYGRAAGPIRNQQMLDEGCPDEVWAFHSNITTSKGTAHMVSIARDIGIKTTIYSK